VQENETNVAPGDQGQQPAKTAENETAGSSPAAAPGGAIEAAAETSVSPTPEVVTLGNCIASVRQVLREELSPTVANINMRLAELDAKLSGIGDGLASELAELRDRLPAAYQAAPGVPTAVPREFRVETVPPPAERVLAVGDPVKVWSDSQHRTFRLGVIKEIEDDGRLFVEFDDGVVSTVWADGLEYDDRR
jgi:hypothetical protein